MTSARENNYGNGAGLPRVPSIPLTDDASSAEDQSIGGLVKDATTHLSTLVRAEVELAKQELTGEVKKGLKGSIWFAVALVVFLYSSFFLFFTLAEVLALWLPRWASFLIVFGLMLAVTVLAALLGWRKLKQIRAPKRTIDSAKDTVSALRNRGENEHADLEPHRG